MNHFNQELVIYSHITDLCCIEISVQYQTITRQCCLHQVMKNAKLFRCKQNSKQTVIHCTVQTLYDTTAGFKTEESCFLAPMRECFTCSKTDNIGIFFFPQLTVLFWPFLLVCS